MNLFVVLCRWLFSFHKPEYYTAIYPYQSTEPDDLCFEQNDLIKVIKKDGDWWTGILNGKTGVFPSNYVQKANYQVSSDSTYPFEIGTPHKNKGYLFRCHLLFSFITFFFSNLLCFLPSWTMLLVKFLVVHRHHQRNWKIKYERDKLSFFSTENFNMNL